jgi:toxin ParE1/3/4
VASKPVRFSPRAERDLEDIADYIAQDNSPRALSFVRELRGRCDKLGISPHAPRQFRQPGADAHILPYGNYVILYRNLATEVAIARIIHGARDIMALIEADD